MPLSKFSIPYPKNIYIHDVRKGLMFSDSSVEVIYCSSFLEHLRKLDTAAFIKECYRALLSKGVIRIIVPDLVQYAKQYMEGIKQNEAGKFINENLSEKFLASLCIFDDEPETGNIFIKIYKKMYDKNIHKQMYDEYSLTFLLEKYGFCNIQRRHYSESLINDIEKIEVPESFYNAVCIEAQKP